MFKNLHQKKKKGQSTVEYIVLVTAVIVLLIYFLGPSGPFATAYNKTLQYGTNGMDNIANRLGQSHTS